MSLFAGLLNRKAIDYEGFTDWHCHILPGVDDGVRKMRDSLEILHRYSEAGIREVWLTPHIMEDIPNTTAALRQRFEELKAEYEGDVVLHLASENMIDAMLKERLDADDLLPIGRERRTLLVETSYFNAPMGLEEALEAVKAKGYYPLLAHPERYTYIDSIDGYRRFREMGVLLQLNLMSLCGHYGPVAREKARMLLDAGMYDRAGSDLHRAEHLDVILSMRLPRKVASQLQHLIEQDI